MNDKGADQPANQGSLISTHVVGFLGSIVQVLTLCGLSSEKENKEIKLKYMYRGYLEDLKAALFTKWLLLLCNGLHSFLWIFCSGRCTKLLLRNVFR